MRCRDLCSSVTRSYYRGAAIVVLVYDLTRHATFAELTHWLDDVRALASPQVVTVLVGNKLDREADEREVATLEASRWAAQHGVLFTETSSLTGENVDVPFILAARSVLLGLSDGTLDPERIDSGIAYGDRLLPRNSTGSHFSFADTERPVTRGLVSWGQYSTQSRCC